MKDKKQSGAPEVKKPPVESPKSNPDRSGQSISGHPDSQGGSRQGNIGHEHNAEGGRGDRQV